MTLTLYQRQFKPSVALTLIFSAFFALFIYLSGWQLDRAGDKRAEQEKITATQSREIELLSRITMDEGSLYYPVAVSGTYEPEHEILIDNIIQGGRAGFYVMTPFRYQKGRAILVNRGWIGQGQTRQDLPQTTAPRERLSISGTLHRPRSKPFMLGDIPNAAPHGGKVRLYTDIAELESVTGLTIDPLIIRLSKDEIGGYSREWPPYDAKIQMHIGYFIHWLVFAIFTVILYIYVSFKKTEDHKDA